MRHDYGQHGVTWPDVIASPTPTPATYLNGSAFPAQQKSQEVLHEAVSTMITIQVAFTLACTTTATWGVCILPVEQGLPDFSIEQGTIHNDKARSYLRI